MARWTRQTSDQLQKAPPLSDCLMLRLNYFVAALGFLIAIPCVAKETVYLTTGFSLQVESHIQRDQVLVFQIGTGTLEFTADQVMRIEIIPDAEPTGVKAVLFDQTRTTEEILNLAAENQGLDEDFVRSVAKVESGLRQEAIS